MAAQKFPADYGTPLTITVPAEAQIEKGQTFQVVIEVATTNTSYAIQWYEVILDSYILG
jgi:hypothetical protein